ncbi:TIGR03086 family metal-binding protein [Streptomyces varsoviensis]|uniref:TIGR03086 family metal-binding protein n=1 Tax=Streptomyces varsoviensis TaxID=67373 RepID=UPI0033CD308E
MDVRALHEESLRSTGQFIGGVRADQWDAPSPCPGWDIRHIVSHLVAGNFWVRELGLGRTIEEVGKSLDGDLLQDDPVRAYEASAAAAAEAFAAEGAMERLWPLSYGERPGRVYARQRFIDVLIHGWDIGTAAGQGPRLPAELVEACTAIFDARPRMLRQWGFAELDTAPAAGDDPQARLLALTGRRG